MKSMTLQKTFQVILESGSPDGIQASVGGQRSHCDVDIVWLGKTAECSFVPVETGDHTVRWC